ncbi:sulfurtransferase TusA family protein [Aestuariispira insulae]|uniref:tRNA 2-thiouridine synthesizing protein A n=1 Tax=Aestuariispira insulae TaxID=1461337 RepID=A0A3D9HWK1_9PROT|nr:sulfurtransferase TusA family protein [Aestuariispira insulae]RED53882.1 tRNA 2-thiouridine synthesizing protein A [Aestuariispira insulae]
MADDFLDASGLLCPLPVLKARKKLKTMADGDLLEVYATDPGAEKDFPAFCRAQGHLLEECRKEGGKLVFRIRKAAGGA